MVALNPDESSSLTSLSLSHTLHDTGLAGLAVTGQGLMGSEVLEGVVPGPALLAEVLEAAHVTAEQGSRVAVTDVTDTVL